MGIHVRPVCGRQFDRSAVRDAIAAFPLPPVCTTASGARSMAPSADFRQSIHILFVVHGAYKQHYSIWVLEVFYIDNYAKTFLRVTHH